MRTKGLKGVLTATFLAVSTVFAIDAPRKLASKGTKLSAKTPTFSPSKGPALQPSNGGADSSPSACSGSTLELCPDENEEKVYACRYDDKKESYESVCIARDKVLEDDDYCGKCSNDIFLDVAVFKDSDLPSFEGTEIFNENDRSYKVDYSVSFLEFGLVSLLAAADLIDSVSCAEGSIVVAFKNSINRDSVDEMFSMGSLVTVDSSTFQACDVFPPGDPGVDPLSPDGFLLVEEVQITGPSTVRIVGVPATYNHLFQSKELIYEEIQERRDLLSFDLSNFTLNGAGAFDIGTELSGEVKVASENIDVTGAMKVSFGFKSNGLVSRSKYEFNKSIRPSRWEIVVDYEYGLAFQVNAAAEATITFKESVTLAKDTVEAGGIPFIGIPGVGYRLPRVVRLFLRRLVKGLDAELGVLVGAPAVLEYELQLQRAISLKYAKCISSGKKGVKIGVKGAFGGIQPSGLRPFIDWLEDGKPTSGSGCDAFNSDPQKQNTADLSAVSAILDVFSGLKQQIRVSFLGLLKLNLGVYVGVDIKAQAKLPPYKALPPTPLLKFPLQIFCDDCHLMEIDVSAVAKGPFTEVQTAVEKKKTKEKTGAEVSLSFAKALAKVCLLTLDGGECGGKCCAPGWTCENDTCVEGSATSPPAARPPPPAAPPVPSTIPRGQVTRGTSDPHIFTWQGRFSYQGACDLVYIDTEEVTIHTRFTLGSNSQFSFISHVAVAIGDDILEVQSDQSYNVNGEGRASLPSEIGGFPLTKGSGITIELDLGQYIRISFYRGTITLEVFGNAASFGDSVGIAGSYFEDLAVLRDGTLLGNANPDEIASIWTVDSDNGDPLLFVEPAPFDDCQLPEPFTITAEERRLAEIACAGIPEETGQFEACVFDILANNGDTSWALNPGIFEDLSAIPKCSSETNCLVGILDEEGTCRYSQLECDNPGESCDAQSGVCKSVNARALGIAVIDESNVAAATIDFLWAQFRSDYPNRFVCLLQVPPTSGTLYVPPAFLEDPRTTFETVNRDNGVGEPSDWYKICDVERFLSQNINFVALFVDNSGSMNTASVQSSYDLFVQEVEDNNLSIRTLEGTDENWIRPLAIDLI